MIIVLNRAITRHEPRFLPFFHYYTHRDRKTFAHLDIPDIEAIHKDFARLVQALSAFGESIGAVQEMRQGDWGV
jgi:hypothetical protein